MVEKAETQIHISPDSWMDHLRTPIMFYAISVYIGNPSAHDFCFPSPQMVFMHVDEYTILLCSQHTYRNRNTKKVVSMKAVLLDEVCFL